MDYPALFSVLGDINRLRIIHLLAQKPLCVCEIEALLDMTQSNVSRHLTRLRSAGIVRSNKEGQWVHYAINRVFFESEKNLYPLLTDIFMKMSICREDKEKYDSYASSGLSCIDIRKDIEAVQELIGGNIHDK